MGTARIHIVPKNRGWVLKSEGAANLGTQVYSRQGEALNVAKGLVKASPIGQIAVHGRDGSIRSTAVHGLPEVQAPPHKSSLGKRAIERAVSAVILDRFDEK
jgi:hypothetical protein